MPAGRPMKFKSVEEFNASCETFFSECVKNKEPFTITGLALALDTTRETLCDYQEKDEFSDAVKRAKLRCENYVEKQLLTTGGAGAIFALKNYGWSDKQEREYSGPGGAPISITVGFPDAPHKG